MAQLLDKPYPGDWEIDWEQSSKPEFVNKEIERIENQLDKIPDERKLEFTIADTVDIYYVKSWEPFVLQRVPFSDRKVSEADIKNLTVKEAKHQIELKKCLI